MWRRLFIYNKISTLFNNLLPAICATIVKEAEPAKWITTNYTNYYKDENSLANYDSEYYIILQ